VEISTRGTEEFGRSPTETKEAGDGYVSEKLIGMRHF
jgi:hypothetical protein